MENRFEKLKALLQELFQLDQPDLDFGFYRIMHVKRAEVSSFLNGDLLPQVQEAFAQYQSADKGATERQLNALIASVENAGMDPEQSPKVQALRATLATDAIDRGTLESETYDHLYRFFRRYYSDGDFLSKRVYKSGVYAIPYEGEEVKIHWANADQYYIKTSEYLRDYTFRLTPDDEQSPMRVHFRLVDGQEGEHSNIKEAEGKQRVFTLKAHDFLTKVNGDLGSELVLRFEYRPATLSDWPEDERNDKSKPPTQKELLSLAERQVFAVKDPACSPWIGLLRQSHMKVSGEKANYSCLRAHLNRYTARNTFDYFVHKDLGGFLHRELDFYIKNEVMHLDDVENDTALRVDQYLSKIKVIRAIAYKIIDFLAQLENFQKKLWLKKKFVVETFWCVRVGCIPEEFYPEIATNEKQREEWVELLAIDEISDNLATVGYSVPLTPEFLKANPTLVIDSRHFSSNFSERLLEVFDGLDEKIDGILFHSENFQAIQLAALRPIWGKLFIYADPPYNAKSSEILYKNAYKHSSWISLMYDRLSALFRLSAPQVTACIAIDENEQEHLSLLLRQLLPNNATTNVSVIHNPGGIQGDNFSYCHEYAVFTYPASGIWIGRTKRAEDDIVPLRDWGGEESKRETAANCFYPIFVKNGKITEFGDVCDDAFHPDSSVIHHPDGTLEIYPVDLNGVERKWRFAHQSVDSIKSDLFCEEVNGEYVIRRRKNVYRFKTVWDDKRYNANSHGSKLLNDMLGHSIFSYPKSVFTVMDSIEAGTGNGRVLTVFDPFAGSGTTGHAVINLNRQDGGVRKFILVEMAEYFDTVVLPRLKKVTFTPEWSDGKPKRMPTQAEIEHSPRIMKMMRLESYEDALNNLEVRRTAAQQLLLDQVQNNRESKAFTEEYILRYMLNVETHGSQSLLNIADFADPTAYRLQVKRPGSDESRTVTVDLLETFNWLIGLTVQHIATAEAFRVEFERDNQGRLRVLSQLNPAADGPWWFRTIMGMTPDGQKTLIIWRKRPGGETANGIEEDNLVLDEWFTRQGYSSKDNEFDLIYVNGDNHLENLKAPDHTWKVRLIEEDFHHLMFDMEGV